MPSNRLNRTIRFFASIILGMFAAVVIFILLAACAVQTVRINTDECVDGEVIILNRCEVEE